MGNFSENDMDGRSEEMVINKTVDESFLERKSKSKKRSYFLTIGFLICIWGAVFLIIKSSSNTSYNDLSLLEQSSRPKLDSAISLEKTSSFFYQSLKSNTTKGLSEEEILFALGDKSKPNESLWLYEQFPHEFGFYLEYALSQPSLPEDYFQMLETYAPDNAFFYLLAASELFGNSIEKERVDGESKRRFVIKNEKLFEEGERLYQIALTKPECKDIVADLTYRRLETLNESDSILENLAKVASILSRDNLSSSLLPLNSYVQAKSDTLSENPEKLEFLLQSLNLVKKIQSNDKDLVDVLVSRATSISITKLLVEELNENSPETALKVETLLNSYEEQFEKRRASRPNEISEKAGVIVGGSLSFYKPEELPTKLELRSSAKSWFYFSTDYLFKHFLYKSLILFLILNAIGLFLFRKQRQLIRPLLYSQFWHKVALSLVLAGTVPLLVFIGSFLSPIGARDYSPLAYGFIPYATGVFSTAGAILCGLLLALEKINKPFSERTFPMKVTLCAYVTLLSCVILGGVVLMSENSKFVNILLISLLVLVVLAVGCKLIVFFKHRENKLFNCLNLHQLPFYGSIVCLILAVTFIPILAEKERNWVRADTLSKVDFKEQRGLVVESRIAKILQKENVTFTDSVISLVKEEL